MVLLCPTYIVRWSHFCLCRHLFYNDSSVALPVCIYGGAVCIYGEVEGEVEGEGGEGEGEGEGASPRQDTKQMARQGQSKTQKGG